jgi:hypothetical protein
MVFIVFCDRPEAMWTFGIKENEEGFFARCKVA